MNLFGGREGEGGRQGGRGRGTEGGWGREGGWAMFVPVLENLESHGIWSFGFQAWKVMEFLSRSWKVMEFDVGKYVCSGAAYCSGLFKIYAGKHVKFRQDINLLWRTLFPRVPVAKLYYRHSNLTSTVCGRWQHSYYNALCRTFSFAVFCKSNQWITALWRRVLPANQCNGGIVCWTRQQGESYLLAFKIDYRQSWSELHRI